MVLNWNFLELFPALPKDLVVRLESAYVEILINYLQHRYEPSELNGGKLSECVIRIMEWHTNPEGFYTPINESIQNFEKTCRGFENKTSYSDTIRFHIPKLLVSLYTLRNKRGVGHIADDINPNFMDSRLVVDIAKWVLSELVRVFHELEIDDAQKLVDSINVKDIPIVWESKQIKRVLDTSLSTKDQTLVLLYSEYPGSVQSYDLIDWVEYSNPSVYRKNILGELHKGRLLEYDSNSESAILTPKGILKVENEINLHISSYKKN